MKVNLKIQLKTERVWLLRHGIADEHVDDLLLKCNHRSIQFYDDPVVLRMLREVMAKKHSVHTGGAVNLKDIESDLQLSIHQRLIELQKATRDAKFSVYLKGANLMPGHKSFQFLSFLRDDTLDARNTFIAEVLPWMVRTIEGWKSRNSYTTADKSTMATLPAVKVTKCRMGDKATAKARQRTAPIRKPRQDSSRRTGRRPHQTEPENISGTRLTPISRKQPRRRERSKTNIPLQASFD